MIYKIAIDGLSGTGKSTVAKRLSKRLSILYVDTGAMYRAITLYLLNNNIDINDEKVVVKNLNKINIELNADQTVKLNGEDVTNEIRENEISKCTPIVSRYKKVREKLVKMQREIAKKESVIMDGRDICTVVFPDADLKLFLTASSRVRAERRYKELILKGKDVNLDDIEKELIERDYIDMHKKFGTLKKADDAIEIDTTNMNEQEVEDKIYDLFVKKVGI